ncbi:MAG: hypothetical protein ACI33P_10975 [Lysinibacillus sp.]
MGFTIFILLFAMILGIITVLLKLPLWLFVAAVIGLSLARAFQVIHVLYRSQDVERIARFLQSSAKNPLYHYTLSLKSGSRQAQLQAIDLVLGAYRSPLIQGMYRSSRAMLEHDYSAAKGFASQIPDEAMRSYTLALVAAAQGEKAAGSYILQKPWMSSIIAATQFYKNGDMTEFERHKQEALANSRGIQYFSNFYYLERIHENIKVSERKKRKGTGLASS